MPVAFRVENGDDWYGWGALLIGWMGLMIGQMGWLANVPFLAALVTLLCRLWRTTMILSGIALLIGLHTFALLHQEVPLDEGGVRKGTIIAFGAAPWIWMVAMAVPALGAWVLRRSEHLSPTIGR